MYRGLTVKWVTKAAVFKRDSLCVGNVGGTDWRKFTEAVGMLLAVDRGRGAAVYSDLDPVAGCGAGVGVAIPMRHHIMRVLPYAKMVEL